MAKGGSESCSAGTPYQEAVGEHRRTVAQPRRGGGTGTENPDQAAPVGNGNPSCQFDDLFNLVVDPAFLVVSWERVRANKGGRTAGVDGVAPRSVASPARLLTGLRAELKARTFNPMPVREVLIPKAGGKTRMLGIATARDRVVQASLKLVLEPIFEADFKSCSYGFRPMRRAQDAIAEIHLLASHSYEWVLEGDIKACFEASSHYLPGSCNLIKEAPVGANYVDA